MKAECQAAGIVGQIDSGADPIPENVLSPEPAPADGRMAFAERNHTLEEAENVRIRLKLLPVQPADFVVLVVGIVITGLGVQELVSGAKHRGSVRQEQQATEILDLPPAQSHHFRRHTFDPFVSTVPTVIVVHTILVMFAIGPVILAVIRDEIIEREAIVRSYVVHALVRVISVGASVRKEVIATIDAPHQIGNHTCFASDETAHIVAKPSVPLKPGDARESVTELVCADIPRLCDQTQ